MADQALTTILRDTWFGSNLPAGALGRLAAVGSLVEIPEGGVVAQEGAPCKELGLVVNGRIALRLAIPGEHDRTILTLDSGDVFGWSAVLPPAIATSTAIAIAPSEVIMFNGDSLRTAMAIDCELAASVYQRLLMAVSRRLVATRVQLLDLYKSSPEPW